MNTDERATGAAAESEAVPLGQRLYDRPFVLLAAGILVMVVLYTLWGLLEILRLPQAPLP